MRKWMIFTMAAALTMGLRPDGHVQAQGETNAAYQDEDGDGIDDRDRARHRMGRRGFFGHGPRLQLDETQRAELKELVDGLRESDATREEIREAVDAKLDEWGVERPERPERPEGQDREGRHPALSEDQRMELEDLVDGLRESDATREEIREAVDAKLDEWGVDRPDRAGRMKGPGKHGRRGDFRGFRSPPGSPGPHGPGPHGAPPHPPEKGDTPDS